MKIHGSAVLVGMLATMIAGCGHSFDFTLAPTNLTSADAWDHHTINGCLNTLGTGHLFDQAGPGQITVGSASGVGSGCLLGTETATSYDRGAVKFDLGKIPAGASFATMDLTFEHAGGSDFSTGPTCVVSINLATVDWTVFDPTVTAASYTGTPLVALNWTINQNPNSADPKGANVSYGFSNKKLLFTADLKPAFNQWFITNNKKPNFGLIFSNNFEPFDPGSSAQCYEFLGNFSLHVVGSS